MLKTRTEHQIGSFSLGDVAMFRRKIVLSILCPVFSIVQCYQVMGDTAKLYVAYEGNSYGVFQSDLDGTNAIDLAGVKNYCVPIGIAIDSQHGKMYLACTSPGEICCANLDGSGVKAITPHDVTVCGGVAVDPTAGYVYWTVHNSSLGGSDHYIKRSNLDGSNCVTLLSSGLSYPEQIGLDLVHQRMYWADFSLGTVQVANLDGSNMQTLSGVAGGRGVAVDPFNGKLYWTGNDSGIWKANLDGTDKQRIISNSNINCPFNIALDIPDGKLYFTDSVFEHSVWQSNLDGTALVQLPGNYSMSKIPYGIAVSLPVPEPSTFILLGIGTISFLVHARRWRKHGA
jgi:DNA-binding beta-propeller fold protein YncE